MGWPYSWVLSSVIRYVTSYKVKNNLIFAFHSAYNSLAKMDQKICNVSEDVSISWIEKHVVMITLNNTYKNPPPS